MASIIVEETSGTLGLEEMAEVRDYLFERLRQLSKGPIEAERLAILGLKLFKELASALPAGRPRRLLLPHLLRMLIHIMGD